MNLRKLYDSSRPILVNSSEERGTKKKNVLYPSIQTTRRSSFHHLGVRMDSNLDAGLPCTMRNGGSNLAGQEVQREHGAEWV